MVRIVDVFETRRRYGFRKQGGLYVCSDYAPHIYWTLPIPLENGINASPDWAWVGGDELIGEKARFRSIKCSGSGRMGLMWIDERYYKRPGVFMDEGHDLGISMPITAVPRGLKLGQTWVLLAHPHVFYRKGVGLEATFGTGPGIFGAFQPVRIEYVIGRQETKHKLQSLVNRGVTLVRLHNLGENEEALNEALQ